MKGKQMELETGCLIDGHWGHYGVVRLVDIAQDLGMEIDGLDESALWAYRNNEELFQDEMTSEYHNASEWVNELADEAENWLDVNVAEEGYMFSWFDGEFFYQHKSWWEE